MVSFTTLSWYNAIHNPIKMENGIHEMTTIVLCGVPIENILFYWRERKMEPERERESEKEREKSNLLLKVESLKRFHWVLSQRMVAWCFWRGILLCRLNNFFHHKLSTYRKRLLGWAGPPLICIKTHITSEWGSFAMKWRPYSFFCFCSFSFRHNMNNYFAWDAFVTYHKMNKAIVCEYFWILMVKYLSTFVHSIIKISLEKENIYNLNTKIQQDNDNESTHPPSPLVCMQHRIIKR